MCDIESIGLGGTFADACIVLENEVGKYHHFKNIRSMLEFMAYHCKYEYFFHNGSGYDFSYFIPDLFRLMEKHGAKADLVRQGMNRVIGIQVKFAWNGKKYAITIRDSLPLLNMSLEKAAKAFAPETQKLVGTIDWDKGETYDKHNPAHIAYLHRDCDSLLAVLTRFSILLEQTFHCSAGWTAGSTAIKAWKSCIPDGHVYWRNTSRIEAEIRQAYYGGYVYPGSDRHLHRNVTSVDINAAYAAAMRKGVPVGTPYETDVFEWEFHGIYHVIAHVPDDIPYPCIPSRDEHGSLLWATGDFYTTITIEEVMFGMERGCTFECLYGYVWRDLEYPFNEFLEKCEEMELAQGGMMKDLAKLLRNALYGKFGSKLHNTAITLSHDVPVDEGWRPVINEETGEMVVGLIEKEELNDADYVQPAWAVYITMWQRLTLFRLMEAVGVACVRYCDTDSVKADADAIDRMVRSGYAQVRTGYGHIKIDEEYLWFQCLGTKNYRGLKTSGDFVDKTKGIPHKALGPLVHFLAAHEREVVVQFDSVNNILARIKNPDLPVSMRRHRTIGKADKSKSWQVKADKSVRPVHRTLDAATRKRLLALK